MNIAEILIVLSITIAGFGLAYPSFNAIKKSTKEQQIISQIIKNHNIAIEESYKTNKIIRANNTYYYPNSQVKPVTLIIGKKRLSIGKYRQIRITRDS